MGDGKCERAPAGQPKTQELLTSRYVLHQAQMADTRRLPDRFDVSMKPRRQMEARSF
jgi:hypothetical protein